MTKVISKRRGVNVTKAEHNLVMKLVKKAVRELSKKKYEFPDFIRTDNCWLEVETKNRGQRSYGGSLGIMIDVSRYRQKIKVLNEYSAFAKDPLIGGAITDDTEVVLFGTVCHEVAHWAQLNSRLARKMKRYKGTFRKSHGKCFQSIYRYLRVALVNPLVKKSQVKVVKETLNSKAFVEAGIDLQQVKDCFKKLNGEMTYASSQK